MHLASASRQEPKTHHPGLLIKLKMHVMIYFNTWILFSILCFVFEETFQDVSTKN